MISQEVYTIANPSYMRELCIDKQMGLSAIQKWFLEKHNIRVSVGFLSNRLKDANIQRRSCSKARRIVSDSPDWDREFLTEETIEAIDGFLLGDGYAYVNHNKLISRISCGVQHKEFCDYCRSFFLSYKASESSYSPDKSGRSSGTWSFRTRFHPDLYKIASRWYPKDYPIKRVPADARITKLSVMLWYLGDGTVINKNNTCTIRLSTDAFPPEDIENILMPKLIQQNIDCCRTSENRIRVKTRSVPQFFDLIGRQSPIECYSYKFNVPEWRFESVRMRDAAKILGVDYNRLSYLTKIGKQPCYRASENGKPRFLPEHLEFAKTLIKEGQLY